MNDGSIADEIVGHLAKYDLQQLKKLTPKRFMKKVKQLTGKDTATEEELVAAIALTYEDKRLDSTCRKFDRLVAAGEIKVTPDHG